MVEVRQGPLQDEEEEKEEETEEKEDEDEEKEVASNIKSNNSYLAGGER